MTWTPAPMPAMKEIDVDLVRRLLNYDSESGVFKWAQKANPRQPIPKIGSIAGGVGVRGYWVIRLCGVLYAAHRLAWAYAYGESPSVLIDHINGNRLDNSIRNLRPADHSTNCQNIRRANRKSKSGLMGASFKPDMRLPWASQIKVDGKVMRLGFFATPEEAHAVYVEAKRRLHKGCAL